MNTERDAQEAGERLKALLLTMAEKYQVAIELISSGNAGTLQQAKIAETLEMVREQIRPDYPERGIILYRAGREQRTFRMEYDRLRNRTLHRVMAEFEGPEEVRAYRNDLRNGIRVDVLAQLAVDTAVQVTRDLLSEHPEFGDDLYLWINHLMTRWSETSATEIMAASGKAPPQSIEALYGILGLLEEAKEAEEQGQHAVAVTLLMDANHLLGLHEGAAYVMQRLERVAKRRRASKNASKSHARTDALKARIEGLFEGSRPTGDDGQPSAWATPKAAFDAVWDALYSPSAGDERDSLEKAQRTIRSHCDLLFKRALSSDRIHIHVVGPLDGSSEA